MHNTRGFSLIELMVALAVAALVLGIGIPNFVDTVRSSNMTATANALVSALHIARSEAVKRRARVTVCRSDQANPPACDADGAGFAVFVNQSDDQTIDVGAGDTIVKTGEWLRGEVQVQYDGLPAYVTYVSSGFTRAIGGGALSGDIVFCDQRGDKAAKILRVAATGRPQMHAHEDVEGAPSCP